MLVTTFKFCLAVYVFVFLMNLTVKFLSKGMWRPGSIKYGPYGAMNKLDWLAVLSLGIAFGCLIALDWKIEIGVRGGNDTIALIMKSCLSVFGIIFMRDLVMKFLTDTMVNTFSSTILGFPAKKPDAQKYGPYGKMQQLDWLASVLLAVVLSLAIASNWGLGLTM